jgi:hypothetical protein
MGQGGEQFQWHAPGSCVAATGTLLSLPNRDVATNQTGKEKCMSNQEIAVRLAAAILQPSITLPPRRANVETGDEQIQHASELAVRVYKTVLGVLQSPDAP